LQDYVKLLPLKFRQKRTEAQEEIMRKYSTWGKKQLA